MDAITPAQPASAITNAFAGLHRLLDWWGQGLRWALPAGMRLRWFPSPTGVWLRWQGDYLQAWVGRRDDTAAKPSADAMDAASVLSRHPDLPRWLLLPPEDAARAVVSLPQAAAAHAREALRYEIDRQTPFAASDVAWDARILSIDSAAGLAHAELIVVPHARLAPVLQRLASSGQRLQGVDVADAAGQPAGINLLPVDARLQPVNRWRRRNLALAAIAFACVWVAAFASLQRERVRADALEASIKQATVEGRRIAAQRQRLVDLTEGASRIHALRSRRAPYVAVLNDLAQRLPANSYIDRLAVQGEQMQISGITTQSTRMVPALLGSNLWRDVAISGVVAADGGRGGERYTLLMRLSPVAAETVQ